MWVKICGITSEEDGLLAIAMGADAVGFVFAPSPRQVSSALVTDIVKRLPREIATVGVFQHEASDRVVRIMNETGLKFAQLHGRDQATESAWIRERVGGVIVAFGAHDPRVEQWRDYPADLVLLDAPTPGSGRVFDWEIATTRLRGARVVVAGGLTPDNVAEAIGRMRPFGVDVSTGVETAPGKKDARKLMAFIDAAKSATVPMDLDAEEDQMPYDWMLDR